MIADNLVDVANWLIQTLIYPLFPQNLPFLSYNTYVGVLNSIKTNEIYIFSVLNKFFPVSLLLIFIIVIISGEITLFLIKGVMFLINLVRGSGA